MKKSFTLLGIFFSATLFAQYSTTSTTTGFVDFKESLGIYKGQVAKSGYWWQEVLDRTKQIGMTINKTVSERENIKVFGFGAGETTHKTTIVIVNEGKGNLEKGDAFDISVNGKNFQFSLEDVSVRGNKVSFLVPYGVMLENKGYRAEVMIPWSLVGVEIDEVKQYVDFQVVLREGTTQHTINWKNNKGIYLEHREIGNNYEGYTSIPVLPPNYEIKIDGFDEFAIANGKSASARIGKIEQETGFRGWWTAAYDKKNLYVWLRVIDKTKQQGDKVALHLSGTNATVFKAYRTIKGETSHQYLKTFQVKNGMLIYDAPYNSITTFVEK